MSSYTKVCDFDYEAASPTILNNREGNENKDTRVYRVYKRRWMILFLFVLYTASNIMQWIQYSIIADVVVKYYGVSYAAADWNSMIFLLLYILFSFPGSYLLDKMNLRVAVILGMLGTCVGAWVKVASVAPDRYWVLLVGQGFAAISDVFILPVPPKLAAVWFGPNEVSKACSIGVFGTQMGVAIGFVIPPMIVNSQMEGHAIESGLYNISIAIAVITSILMLILLLFFQAKPPTPPSAAQSQSEKKKSKTIGFKKSLMNVMLNQSFVLLTVAYGINVGVFYTISMLLNQIILKYHPDATVDAGIIGLILIFSGMIGALLSGIILDKYGRYKETVLVMYALSVIVTIVFTFMISSRIEVIYLLSGLLGFSMIGILTIGLELGVELTYPEPEGTSGGLLTTSAQVFGIIFTYLYSFLFNNVGDIWANVSMCAFLFLGNVLIVCIRFDLRRYAVQKIADSYN